MFDLSVIVAWAKRRGFVYPGSDIYGGLANAWDYGPYGIQLKKNIQDLWWHTFVERRPDMIGLDSQILMHPQVWVASGHVAGFNDPLIDDKNTGERFRADKLIEEHIEQIRVKYAALEEQARDELINSYRKEKDSEYEHMQNVAASFEHADHFLLDERKKHYQVANLIPESWSLEQMREVIVGEGIRNPHSKKDPDWTDVRKFELMFYTHQGVIHDDESKIWMRPETAQGIFVNFKNILDTTRMRLPFGIAQVGKAFRNEITPGNFLYRTREFEQMEIEYFVSNDESVAMESFKERQEMSMERRQTTMQLNQDNLRFREHESDELSHYSRGTFDVEYHYPRGRGELQGIAYRTDFDLRQHQEHSGKDMQYQDPYTGERFLPHVIEPSFGLSRTVLAVIFDCYDEEQYEDGNGKQQTRVVTRFPKQLAPVKFAILPLIKKDEAMTSFAKELFTKLADRYICEYDEGGNIGKRYRRQDEIGTPYCLTIDHQTIEEQQAGHTPTVTIRDRDTMEQERVAVDEISL